MTTPNEDLTAIKTELALIRETFEEVSVLRGKVHDLSEENEELRSVMDQLIRQTVWRHHTDTADIKEGELVQVAMFEMTTGRLHRD